MNKEIVSQCEFRVENVPLRATENVQIKLIPKDRGLKIKRVCLIYDVVDTFEIGR